MRYPETASLIRSARLRKGISQEKAARRVGCTRLQWINWEKGAHRPVRFVNDLVDVLGLDRDELSSADPEDERLSSDLMQIVQSLERLVDGRVERALASKAAR